MIDHRKKGEKGKGEKMRKGDKKQTYAKNGHIGPTTGEEKHMKCKNSHPESKTRGK